MADLSNQHISQSYQNLLQVENDNKVVTDGLGNILNILTVSGTLEVSGTVNALYDNILFNIEIPGSLSNA